MKKSKLVLSSLIIFVTLTGFATADFDPDSFDWESVKGYPFSNASHGGSYCIDSDEGINLNEKGITKQWVNNPGPPDENGLVKTNYVPNNEHEDYCESGWHVVEGICEAEGLWLVYGWNCPEGEYCSEGACIKCATEDCEERYDPEECNDPAMKEKILSEHCGDGECLALDCEDSVTCPIDCGLPEAEPVKEPEDKTSDEPEVSLDLPEPESISGGTSAEEITDSLPTEDLPTAELAEESLPDEPKKDSILIVFFKWFGSLFAPPA